MARPLHDHTTDTRCSMAKRGRKRRDYYCQVSCCYRLDGLYNRIFDVLWCCLWEAAGSSEVRDEGDLCFLGLDDSGLHYGEFNHLKLPLLTPRIAFVIREGMGTSDEYDREGNILAFYGAGVPGFGLRSSCLIHVLVKVHIYNFHEYRDLDSEL